MAVWKWRPTKYSVQQFMIVRNNTFSCNLCLILLLFHIQLCIMHIVVTILFSILTHRIKVCEAKKLSPLPQMLMAKMLLVWPGLVLCVMHQGLHMNQISVYHTLHMIMQLLQTSLNKYSILLQKFGRVQPAGGVHVEWHRTLLGGAWGKRQPLKMCREKETIPTASNWWTLEFIECTISEAVCRRP